MTGATVTQTMTGSTYGCSQDRSSEYDADRKAPNAATPTERDIHGFSTGPSHGAAAPTAMAIRLTSAPFLPQ
jgi:hypothetical protein